MNSGIDVSRLIDNRNESIFNKVNEMFDVKFEPSSNGEHSVYTIQNSVTFYIPLNTYCIDSFSHELLHTYMDYHGVNLGENFKVTMWKSNTFKRLFDMSLAEHITNSISHTLMLPLYLKLGYDRSKFLFDYATYKTEIGFINQISKQYKQGNQFNLSAVRNFIGKYFAFKCDPNPDFDYTNDLKQLKKTDLKLYEIVDTYFNAWNGYDFTNDGFSIYKQKTSDFYNQLKLWLNGKRFY